MRLEKRGFIIYTIIKIVVGVSFALLLLWYAYEKGTGVDFERTYLAKDIALTIDALYGVPGNAVVDYDNRYMEQFNPRYDIHVAGSIVEVYSHTAPDLVSTYPYGEVAAYPINILLERPSYLAFVLQNGRIGISQTATAAQLTGCPEADTKADIKAMTLLFEPGQYEGEKGNVKDDLEEHKLTRQIANTIEILCTVKGYTCKFIQQQDLGTKTSEIKDTKKDVFISIHIGSADQSKNPAIITAPLADVKSSKLTCLMSNRFRKDFDPVETQIADVSKAGENDDIKVLQAAMPAPSVRVEIANINRADFLKDPNNLADIASGIIESIEEYYK